MSGTSLSAMAWRNLWRNRRRTLITLSSIAFGVFLAVLMTGLGDRTYSGMIDLAARNGGGHVSIEHPEYLESPSIKRTITEVKALTAMAEKDPLVRRTAVRVNGFTLLSTAANNTGAFFIAYDPKSEDKETFSLLETLKEGSFFEDGKSKGIILGVGLAETLDTKLGRKVVYTLTDKNGEMVTGLARVQGIIRTGASSVDSNLALLPIDAVREVLGYAEDEATMVAVYIKDQRASDEVAKRLGAKLPKGAVAVTWSQAQPELSGFITMKVSGTQIFEFIIMLLVAAGIFNTIFVSVMERMREFGIMMAIGFSPGKLFRLVMWESLWLGLAGIVASALVTAWPYYHFATTGLDFSKMVGGDTADIAGVALDPVMRVGIFPENALLIAALAVGATLLAGLYPAWKAGRVVPVETIKLV